MVVDGNINVWLCDFLTNRHMKVVDGEKLEAISVDSGLLQGMVLGRLLFQCCR